MQRIVFLSLLVLGVGGVARADKFTYQDADGEMVTLDAKLYGAGQGFFALETAGGRIELVPEAAVSERVPGKDPVPLTQQQMVEQLTEQFGAERFRADIKSPFVCGLVLTAPLSSSVEESRCRAFLKKTGDFMKRIESIFEDFARQVHLPLETPTHPLVVLIFETDDDFETYTVEATGGRGLSAGNIAGFYSAMTNFLAIRMSECHTFDTPLHEAIHQQVYNRQVLKRLAPLPAWFNEGIATGFEGNGDRIRNGPVKVNSTYARRAAADSPVGWQDLVEGDGAFRGDVFAGDAYVHAWSMHWLLVNNYQDQYTNYVKRLARKESLAKSSEEERLKEFEDAFGQSPGEFQTEFLPKLKLEIRRQKVKFEPRATGRDTKQINLAEVDFSAVLRPQGIQVSGKLTNISYVRDMAYYVTAETSTGLYADWYLPNVSVNRTMPLKPQFATKRLPDVPIGLGNTVRLKVRAAALQSEEAEAWKRGQFK